MARLFFPGFRIFAAPLLAGPPADGYAALFNIFERGIPAYAGVKSGTARFILFIGYRGMLLEKKIRPSFDFAPSCYPGWGVYPRPKVADRVFKNKCFHVRLFPFRP